MRCVRQDRCRSLVLSAFFLKVGSVSIQDVNVLLLDVDVREEVGPHEAVIAFGVLFGQAHVLVHIEGDDVLERNLAGLVHFDEVLIEAKRRGAGGATQLERLFWGWICGIDFCGNILGSPAAKVLIVRFDDYSHNFNAFLVSTFTMQSYIFFAT